MCVSLYAGLRRLDTRLALSSKVGGCVKSESRHTPHGTVQLSLQEQHGRRGYHTVECFYSMCEALGLSSSTAGGEEKKAERGRRRKRDAPCCLLSFQLNTGTA